jgi:hypothetical protein
MSENIDSQNTEEDPLTGIRFRNSLYTFVLNPSLYYVKDGAYKSTDNHPYNGTVSIQLGSCLENENIPLKIQDWMSQRDLVTIGVNKAVLDPMGKMLYCFDIVMKNDEDDDCVGIIGIISSCEGGRNSLQNAREHAENVSRICEAYYSFSPRVVIFRISVNGSLRPIFTV